MENKNTKNTSIDINNAKNNENTENYLSIIFCIAIVVVAILAFVAKINGNEADVSAYSGALGLLNFLYWMNRALTAEKKLEKPAESEPKPEEWTPKNDIIAAIMLLVVAIAFVSMGIYMYYNSFIFDTETKFIVGGLFFCGIFSFLASLSFGVVYTGEINPNFRKKLPEKWQSRIEERMKPVVENK